ncbi:hypothetical protein Q9966_010126, partial [Columba livia]
GAAIRNVPSKRQGLAYRAIPTAGKADALPGCPCKAAAGSSASTRAVITCQPNDPDGFLFCLSLKPPLDPHSQFGKWGGTGVTKAQWHYGQSSRQTSQCRWVFSGDNLQDIRSSSNEHVRGESDSSQNMDLKVDFQGSQGYRGLRQQVNTKPCKLGGR